MPPPELKPSSVFGIILVAGVVALVTAYLPYEIAPNCTSFCNPVAAAFYRMTQH